MRHVEQHLEGLRRMISERVEASLSEKVVLELRDYLRLWDLMRDATKPQAYPHQST